jgi:hypothetical protein
MGKSRLAKKVFDDFKNDKEIITFDCVIQIVELIVKMKLIV